MIATLGTAPASAHQVPGGCLVNGIDLTLFESATLVRPGDTMTFRVGIRNDNNVFGLPCYVSAANAEFRLPSPDGTYGNSPAIQIAVNQDFPSMFGFRQIGPDFTWVVNLNPRVEGAAAFTRVRGILHVNQDIDTGNINKDISFRVTNPSLTIDKTGSIINGLAPQNVTYTYVVTNTSQTPVPMNRVGVADDLCANPTYVSGDNGDNLLSNGEQWTFTCTTLHQAPGVYTNTAKACAISTVDQRDVCSPPDTWTVTLTPPQVGVRPANAVQQACTLSTPRGLRVRARERTTIRVRTREVDAGTRVTITLPGGRTVSARTNSRGLAVLRVTPPRTGTARIRVAECSAVERLTVRQARQVVSRRVPRVTG
jgi:hypothetical protein